MYIITVVHNRKSVTSRFAELLKAQTAQGFQLILVDDGSVDGTSEEVTRILPNTVVLKGDGNLWWAGGLQKALNWLSAQSLEENTVVGFTNDDISFQSDYLEKARTELLSLPKSSFLVVPGIFQPSGRMSDEAGVTNWPRYRYEPFYGRPERIDHATTRTLFMRWGDLRKIGGFHPTLLPHYTSDYEFTIRARRKGVHLVPATSTHAYFYEETTGDHRTKGLTLSQKLKLIFSPRFSFNPIHHFFFIWYAAPVIWKIPCWARVIWSTVKFLR